MNLVSKTIAGSTKAQIFECIEPSRTLRASSQNLSLVASPGRLAARETNQDLASTGDLPPTIWTSLMSTLNGKTIFRSLKLLNPTVGVYSNLQRNMGRKPEMKPSRKVVSGKHSICTHFPKDRNCDICLKTKNNAGSLQKTCWYGRAQSGKFGWLDSSRSQSSEWWLWISKQSPIRCRGTRFGNSMDPITSAQNKNFKGNRKKPAKVRGADAETQSHLRWQFPRIWQSLRRFILESLSVNTSPSRDEQDCWKSGTSAALLQWGLDEKWWADFMECSCYLRYNSRSLVWWEDTLRKAIRRTN